MEVSDPVTREIIPLVIGKRRIEIPLESRAECRALIRAVALACEALPDDGEGFALDLDASGYGMVEFGRVPLDEVRLVTVPAPEPARREPCSYVTIERGACVRQAHGDDLPHVDRQGVPFWPAPARPAAEAPLPTGVAAVQSGDLVDLAARRQGLRAVGADADEGFCGLVAGAGGLLEWCALKRGHPAEGGHRNVNGAPIATGDVTADGDGGEPDDGPEPYHVATGTAPHCGATATDPDGDDWDCNAQRGHGGRDHIAWDVHGVERYRWPVSLPAPALCGMCIVEAVDGLSEDYESIRYCKLSSGHGGECSPDAPAGPPPDYVVESWQV